MFFEVKNLCKRYNKKIVLDDISFLVDKGKIVGLLGENGVGKIMFLKIIVGFFKFILGQVFINNIRVGVEICRYVVFLLDLIMFLKWMKVKDVLKFFVDFFDDFDLLKVKDMFEFLNISENGKIYDFLRGIIEKFFIVFLFLRNINLYFLDEFFVFVDLILRDVVINMILDNFSEDRIVIVLINIIFEIEYVFDEIIIFKDGKIVFIDLVENLREKLGVFVN